MIILVSGGASNGKSAFAENLAATLSDNRYYLATMRCFDKEAKEKKNVHIKKREDKDFITIEQYKNIDKVEIEKNSVVLLECLPNLLANESYEDDALEKENPRDKIIYDIKNLSEKCENLVVVTNEIFSDGIFYDEFTTKYISDLGAINVALAEISQSVIEVVVGIPIYHKGEKICTFLRQ